MEWNEVEKGKLPDGWVLTACFDSGAKEYKQKVIGELFLYNGVVCAACDEGVFKNVTHYVDIDKFDL
jgi:hypothetical protein